MTTLSLPVGRSVPRVLDSAFAALARPELLLGATGAVVSFAGSWIPSYWGDEAASVMSAERSLPSLWSEVRVVDAVHGAYYLFLHVWIHFFGASELATRLPSAIAVGLAVGGTVLLARRWWGRRTAWAAGALAIAVPALTNLGMEARSYAFSMAITVWMTVLLLRLRRRGSRRAWIFYAAALAASAYLFLYLLLLIPLHAGLLVLSGTRRAVWRRWLVASVVASVVALPIVAVAYGQRSQISFLAARGYANPADVLVRQWFDQPFAAAVAWALILAGLVWVLTRSRPRRRALARRWAMTAVMAGGVTAMLLAGNLITPLYNLRYTSSAIPAVAVLMGVGAVAVGRMSPARLAPIVSTVAVVVFALAALPSYVGQRTIYGKDGSDLREISQLMGRVGHRGDPIVFDQSVHAHLRPRLALHLYPVGFRALDDVGLVTPYQDVRGLWDEVLPVSALPGAVAGHRTVWAIEALHGRMPDVRELEADRYEAVAWYPLHRDEAVELVTAATWTNSMSKDHAGVVPL